MATTPNSIITPQSPLYANASLAAATACTTRGPIATANITSTPAFGVVLLAAGTNVNGARLDFVTVKANSTAITSATVAQTVIIWLNDGTNYNVFKEILVTAVTPSTTVASFDSGPVPLGIVIPAGSPVAVSTTITTTASTTALDVHLFGALL